MKILFLLLLFCHVVSSEYVSVSFFQKTPSSPLSCHATGFYPGRAEMFWRKDGEELHEDVDRGEILPNHDGTFQMRADLNLSSVKPKDWGRYDCVFHLSGAENDIVTKLDKWLIRTNRDPPSFSYNRASVIRTVGTVLVVAVFIYGVFICMENKGEDAEEEAELYSVKSLNR